MKVYRAILSYAADREKGFTTATLERDLELPAGTEAAEWVAALLEHGLIARTGQKRKGRPLVIITERGRYVLAAR